MTAKSQEKPLTKSFSIVGMWTAISQFLGIARDIILTSIIGPGVILDTFIVVIKITYSFKLFLADSIPKAFIPVMSEYISRFGKNGAKDLISHSFGAFLAILSVITILVLILAPLLLMIALEGNSSEIMQINLSSDLLRIIFPFLFFVSLASLAGSILNTYEEFFIPSFTPIFYNLSIIISAIWIAPYFQIPIYVISWGVLFSGVIQFSIHLIALKQRQLLPSFAFQINHPGVSRILKAIIPITIIGSVYQISILLGSLASIFLQSGNASWFYIAERVLALPLNAFAFAIGVVILPRLSKLFSEKNLSEFSKTIDWSFRLTILIGFPSTIGLMTLSEPIIMTLYERGQFLITDTERTSASLFFLSFGLMSFMLTKVISPVFFAINQFSKALIICVLSILINLILLIFLGFFLELGSLGFAMACSATGFFIFLLLLRILIVNNIYRAEPGWLSFIFRLIMSSFILFLSVNFLNMDISEWRSLESMERIRSLIFIILVGVISYGSSLWFFGMRMRHIKK